MKTIDLPTTDDGDFILNISYYAYALQDVKSYNSLDAYEELVRLLRHEIEQKIGDRRGEVVGFVYLDPFSFEPRKHLLFKDNGKYSADELWGYKIEQD